MLRAEESADGHEFRRLEEQVRGSAKSMLHRTIAVVTMTGHWGERGARSERVSLPWPPLTAIQVT